MGEDRTRGGWKEEPQNSCLIPNPPNEIALQLSCTRQEGGEGGGGLTGRGQFKRERGSECHRGGAPVGV